MIILDARRVKAYDVLNRMGKNAGKEKEYIDGLWDKLSTDKDLYDEFVFFVENSCFQDKVKVGGYAMTDLYFYLMRCYEIKQDIGKNYADCDKDGLALDAFVMMSEMQNNPEPFRRRYSVAAYV